MTPALLIRSLESSLRPLITEAGGKLDVSETPEEAISLLAAAKPKGWRAVIQWAGEEGDDATHGTSSLARIAVVLQAPRGLLADRGDDAHRAKGDHPPILELADQVKRHIHSLTYVDDDAEEEGTLRHDIEHFRNGTSIQCFRFVSGDWLEIEGVSLRQYEMTFSIRYASA